jgi:hypothetical protein
MPVSDSSNLNVPVRQISFEDVKKYVQANIPIRPLDPNGKPDVSNIFYEGEDSRILDGLPDALRKWVTDPVTGKIQPLKLLAAQPLTPREFWTDDRIERQRLYGIECQSGFNASLSCIVLGFDADKSKPRAIVQNLIDNYGLSQKTIVQYTPHGGLHLIVKIPCERKTPEALLEEVENWRKKALYLKLCREDCNIEIKTATMGITLAPSRHRVDGLPYVQVGVLALEQVPSMFYDFAVDKLKSENCIKETPQEHHARLERDAQADFTPLDPNAERYNLNNSAMTAGIDIILGKDGKGVPSAYTQHHRHDMVLSLSGYLLHRYVTKESVRAFVQKLGEVAGDFPDDISNSLSKVEDRWRRVLNNQSVRSKTALIEAFAQLEKDDKKSRAFGEKRFSLLVKTLGLHPPKTIATNQEEAATDNKNSQEDNTQQETLEAELVQKIPDRDYAEYLIETIKCTVKQEDALVRQIVDTIISKETQDPINLAVMAPTSEGKTYAVTQALQYFSQRDIWKIGSMSPKTIIRQNGILVNSDNQPIAYQVKDLKKKIRESEKDSDEKYNFEEQLKRLYADAKVLINLQGKVLVFLEPPENGTWDILKPILSHDSFEIEHPYVGDDFKVKKVVTRGWPACIFCSAKNESSWPTWPEIQSRFLITSPNMIKRKYRDGNILTAQRMGLPGLLQEQIIVSKIQVDLATKCASYTLGQVKQCSIQNTNPVWIPYTMILGKVLPAEKGTDNRIVRRIFTFLKITTLSRAHLRCKLKYGNESMVISDIDEDLHEVLHITQNLSGVPPFKLKVFESVFLPLYKSKKSPAKKDNREEAIIAVTAKELCDSVEKVLGRTINVENMKNTYLSEFLNSQMIDHVRSEIDKRENIYFPLIDTSNSTTHNDVEESEKYGKCVIISRLHNILQHPRIMVSKNYNITADNWLERMVFTLQKYTTEISFFDKDGEKLCPCKFIENYQKRSDLNSVFSRPIFYSSNKKIFGDITYLSTITEASCKQLPNWGHNFALFTFSKSEDSKETSNVDILTDSPHPDLFTGSEANQSNSSDSLLIEYVNSSSPANGKDMPTTTIEKVEQEQQKPTDQVSRQSNDSMPSMVGDTERSLQDTQVPVGESSDSTDNKNVNRISLIPSPRARVQTNDDYEDIVEDGIDIENYGSSNTGVESAA